MYSFLRNNLCDKLGSLKSAVREKMKNFVMKFFVSV